MAQGEEWYHQKAWEEIVFLQICREEVCRKEGPEKVGEKGSEKGCEKGREDEEKDMIM